MIRSHVHLKLLFIVSTLSRLGESILSFKDLAVDDSLSKRYRRIDIC